MSTPLPTAIVLSLALLALSAEAGPRTIHVFVALCDNNSQGIVPVPEKIGNGDDLANNLYWGCADGLKTAFTRSADWQLVASAPKPAARILERCVFRHAQGGVFLVADAYRGAEIQAAIADFLNAAAGNVRSMWPVNAGNERVALRIGGDADLGAYIGHHG